MYNEFYGFSEKPFELTPDPKFLYFTPSHREALDSMIDGIKNRRRFISITGEVGTGKTILIHSLLNSLDEKVKTVYVFHPTITFRELLETIFLELNLNVAGRGESTLLFELVKYATRLEADEAIAIIIDEAQSLSEEVMEKVQIFSELEPGAIQIVFAGQPEFEDMINSQRLRQLEQRIGSKHQIKALSKDESENYINHRLGLVGSSSLEVLTPEAISLICNYAQGIPRIINVLCDNAFLAGYSVSQKRIEVDIIRDVIKKMERPLPEKTFLSPIFTAVKKFRAPSLRLNFLLSRLFVIVLFFLCLGGFLFLINRHFQTKPVNTWDIKSLKNPYADTQASLTSSSQGGKEENRKGETTAVTGLSSEVSQTVTPPLATESSPSELGKSKEVVIVEKGQTLSYFAQKYYKTVNITLVSLILDFNPEITNADHIEVDQKIRIPKITEELLIVRSPGNTYKIHIGTFQNPRFMEFYKNELALKGKVIEVSSRKVSPEHTWYRVLGGPFSNRDECIKVIDRLKRKGLLPIFGGGPKTDDAGQSRALKI